MHEETSPYGALQREKKTPGSVGWMHRPLAYIDVFYISLSLKKYFALLKEAETDCKGWQKDINYCLLNIYLNAQKKQVRLFYKRYTININVCHVTSVYWSISYILSFHSMEQPKCNRKSEQTPFILLVFECNFSLMNASILDDKLSIRESSSCFFSVCACAVLITLPLT